MLAIDLGIVSVLAAVRVLLFPLDACFLISFYDMYDLLYNNNDCFWIRKEKKQVVTKKVARKPTVLVLSNVRVRMNSNTCIVL